MKKQALVIGGGMAGISAAKKIANSGYPVLLVEQSTKLGGNLTELTALFPGLDSAPDILQEELDQITNLKNVKVLHQARLTRLDGKPGRFTVDITVGQDKFTEEVGALVVATGFRYFDPTIYTEYGYGRIKKVFTSLEFEKLLSEEKVAEVAGRPNPVIVFVHCVGSRDRAKGYRYCSKICCVYTAKQAILLKQQLAHSRSYVFYIDIRAMGKGYEEFVRDAMEQYGARYIRGRVAKVLEQEEKLLVRAEDSLIGNPVEMEADLVVLASAMEPRPEARELAEILDIECDSYGFFKEAQINTCPARSTREGIFLAGSCTAPMEINHAVALGGNAAAEVVNLFAEGINSAFTN